jgi:hypothetical protein
MSLSETYCTIFLIYFRYPYAYAYRIMVGNSEGKRPLGKPRRRWVDNIKIDLRETEWGGMDWIDLD